MKQDYAILGTSPGHNSPRPSRLHSLLVWLVCLSFGQLVVAMAQTNAPAPLQPAAQEALNKGIIAAKLPDYLLAIRYFEDARKLAPGAPVIYLNLGLAESKIPGRELRAIAWLGAYLAASPNAPNAVAVKEQITLLDVRNQSNISRLIRAVQDAANQIPDVALPVFLGTEGFQRDRFLFKVADLLAQSGNYVDAQKTANLMRNVSYRSWAQSAVAEAQARNGDIAGAQKTFAEAQKTADLVTHALDKLVARSEMAKAQARSGDIAGALKTADLIADSSEERAAIAEAQLKAGDIAGALSTANLIQNPFYRSLAQKAIAEAQAKAATSNTALQNPVVITVSDWLGKLDDDEKTHNCPLNTGPFLDLAGYLKSFPPSDRRSFSELTYDGRTSLRGTENPQTVFKLVHETAEKIVTAQNVIIGMLKQQARQK
jgi:tetratricopeptide (TPR) repeat protein